MRHLTILLFVCSLGLAPFASAQEIDHTQELAGSRITFEKGTATLTPASQQVLEDVINHLKNHPEITWVRVKGHTDTTGSSEINQKLSEKRAFAVWQYMTHRGIQSDRLRLEAHGPSTPVADNTSQEGRAKNRRVEFELVVAAEPEKEVVEVEKIVEVEKVIYEKDAPVKPSWQTVAQTSSLYLGGGLLYHNIKGVFQSGGASTSLVSDLSYYGELGWSGELIENKWKLWTKANAQVLDYNADQIAVLTESKTLVVPQILLGTSYAFHPRFAMGIYAGPSWVFFLRDAGVDAIALDTSIAMKSQIDANLHIIQKKNIDAGILGLFEFVALGADIDHGFRAGGGAYMGVNRLRFSIEYAWSNQDSQALDFNDQYIHGAMRIKF
ncbi:MAG: OmpA family protein [Deltaproteobacteria bacterium]|nr:OmpA family protein [Deltaproteobacteria bacterium]